MYIQFSPVPFSHSVVSNSSRPRIAARQASLSITSSRSLLKFMSIESVMPSSHLILRRPLLLLPQIPPSIRVFSNESTLRMRWPEYWSFSFSISPSNEHPGLISFRMDMYITICEIDDQSKFDAWNRALTAGALGWLRGMGWGGTVEGGSGWGTRVYPRLIHVKVWQNPPQYCN